jgi:uncharacterized SAM-binding protein YcdF (DUF218 family)
MIDILLDPLALFALLLLLWLLFSARGNSTFYSVLIPSSLLIVLMLVSSPAIVNPVLSHYENKLHSDACKNDTSLPIVLLGGGIDGRATDDKEVHFLKHASYVRSVRAAQLSLSSPQAILYLAGGVYAKVAESEVMASLLKMLGVMETRMRLDKNSLNTFENAMEVSRLMKKDKQQGTVRLVTSALHMPRAAAVFRRVGVRVCPVPVDYQAIQNVPFYTLVPQSTVLVKSSLLLHEVIGTIYYRYKNWL